MDSESEEVSPYMQERLRMKLKNELSNKRICVFQINFTDLNSSLFKYNAISPVLKSGLFDKIVLAAPNLKQNSALKQFASKYGIDLYLGDVDNVAKRLFSLSKKYRSKIIVKPSINWFFLDTKLIGEMINSLQESSADIVTLPINFDIRFGAEVFSVKFLEKILDIFAKNKNDEDTYKFRPWAYAELYPGKFKVVNFKEIPIYKNSYHRLLLSKMKHAWPEQRSFSETSIANYKFAAKFIKHSYNTLDIACGMGDGTYLLSKFSDNVVGLDYSREAIKNCKKKYRKIRKIKFIEHDAMTYNFPENYFDVVVSFHTMEHIKNDRLFLTKLHGCLKENGLFILEVPIRMKYPFAQTKIPINPHHIREYDVSKLTKMVSSKLTIKEEYGVNKGAYVNVKNARNGVFFVARKK